MRAAGRLIAVAVHVSHGVLISRFAFDALSGEAKRARVLWWSRKLLRVLDVAVEVDGRQRATPALLVANQVSWLDIVVLNAIAPVRFVSKADVRHWPGIDRLAASAATIFLERGDRRAARRAVETVAVALRDGSTVVVFPEGTTGHGRSVLPIHAGLAAVRADACAQPIALRFADRHAPFSPSAVYAGATTLATSLWRIASPDDLVAKVAFLPPIDPGSYDRRLIAALARHRIQAALDLAEA